MSTRNYINMSQEDVVIENVTIPAIQDDNLIVTEIDENLITEEINEYLELLVEEGIINPVTIVAYGSEEEKAIRAARPELQPLDREEFKKKWYKGKINEELDAPPLQSMNFVEATPRDNADTSYKQVTAQANRSKMNSIQGRNHDKEVENFIEKPKSHVYFPETHDGKDIANTLPVYDNRNLHSQKQIQKDALEQRRVQAQQAATVAAQSAPPVAAPTPASAVFNPIVLNVIGN